MKKPVILTGIRANNDLTIGNYFGAILPMIDMATTRATDYQINLFVPDLHSFTTPIDHAALPAQIMHAVRVFVAAGLPIDHPDVHIYRQSYIPAHSELTWILDCFTGFGEMRRMTQFKDKAAKLLAEGEMVTGAVKQAGNELRLDLDQATVRDTQRQDRISVGLFNYPVLMAADMLLYGARYVPVGEDQTQHLEFTRDIGERFNKIFSEPYPEGIFQIPEPVPAQHAFFGKDQGLRIKDLVEPTKKMSKSDDTGKGVIFLGDNPDAAAKKIMAATTDSIGQVHYDPAAQPGISNLLQILALLSHRSLTEVTGEWNGRTNYGELKAAVAEGVRGFLSEFQTRLDAVDDAALLAKLETSEQAMNEIANATLLKAQRAVGLRAR